MTLGISNKHVRQKGQSLFGSDKAREEKSMRQQAWHVLPWLDVAKVLDVHPVKGLSVKEVHRRLLEVGENVLAVKKGVHPVFLFLGQFKDFMVLVLLAATVVSGLLGEIADAITILAILIINAILGFVQEYRAERSMESLRSLTAPEARVLREGIEQRIPATDVVPGDIVLLEAGDRIPADVRWIQSVNMQVEESVFDWGICAGSQKYFTAPRGTHTYGRPPKYGIYGDRCGQWPGGWSCRGDRDGNGNGRHRWNDSKCRR